MMLDYIYEWNWDNDLPKKHKSEAIKFYQKACELNYNYGCFKLGMTCGNNHSQLDVRQDYFKSVEYLEKSCELKSEWRGIILELDINMEKILEKIIERLLNIHTRQLNCYKQSCKLGNGRDCNILGYHHEKGDGNNKDLKIYTVPCQGLWLKIQRWM